MIPVARRGRRKGLAGLLAVLFAAAIAAGIFSWHSTKASAPPPTRVPVAVRMLSWTSIENPPGAVRTRRTITMWVEVAGDGTVSRLYSTSTSHGGPAGHSAYPAGPGRMAISEGSRCQLERPASPPTLRKVLVDSIGPVDASDMEPEFVPNGTATWTSHQGPVKVALRQSGSSVSSRRITMTLQPAGVEVAVIEGITYSTGNKFPDGEYTALIASCAGAPFGSGPPPPPLRAATPASPTK